jgi:hypothetical protein
LAGCVARFADRPDDWSVFGFETALDPKFACARQALSGRLGFGRSQRPARLNSGDRLHDVDPVDVKLPARPIGWRKIYGSPGASCIALDRRSGSVVISSSDPSLIS